MVAVPFIYFTLLLLYIIRKKRTFEISAYVVSLYLISSFFSILIDLNHLRSFDTINYQISIVPTVLYCFLLTLTIWPFYQFKSEKIINIKLIRQRLFDWTVYFFFICFILIVVTSWRSAFKILTGNLVELRAAVYKGESFSQIPSGIFKPFFIVADIFGGFSIVMLLFYFYSIVYLNKSKLFNIIILLSSMSLIVISIIGVDRSKVVYWMITYVFMLVFFWQKMSKNLHKKVLIISILSLLLPIIYFLSLTVSRFSTRDTGTQGGIITYAGQSFINFCFFFDDVHYKTFTLQRVFPLFYKLFVNNGIADNGPLNEIIGLNTGKSIAVFSTFVGDIMVASGKLVTILYCILFYIVTRISLNFKQKKNISFYQIVLVFCFITVPMLGIFAHFYNIFARVIPFFIFVFYSLSFRFKNKKLKEYRTHHYNNVTRFTNT